MKKIFTIQILIFAFIFLGGIFTNNVSAQCETWLEPTPATSWGDFNDFYGGAPCEGETGCKTNEITDFQVFASESYLINKFIKGGEYAFSMCNGPGAGSWVPEFTIIAPSGAIDAFGAGDGDSCTITWTATENGSYTIVINELDSCGTESNIDVSNGYPAITCLGNTPCPDYCNDWISPSPGGGWTDFNTDFGGAPCDDGTGCAENEITAFEVFAAEAYTVDNFQQGGEYSFSMCNGPGAGSWVPEFTIITPSGEVDAFGAGDGDSCTISWTASESGTYLIVINEQGQCGGGDNTTVENGFPSITCLGNTTCDSTMVATCTPGSLTSELNQTICGDSEIFEIKLEGTMTPDSGGIGILFEPGEEASGGPANPFSLSGSTTNSTFDSGLNGILASNNLDPLAGLWVITLFTYENKDSIQETICSFTEESINVFFNPKLTVSVEDLGSGSAMVSASGGSPPYSYVWSDPSNLTTETVESLADGDYTVTVTDDKGCTMEGEVSIMTSAILNEKSIQDISITPNPTTGQLWLNIQNIDVNVKLMDINGRVLTTNMYRSSVGKVMLDLSNYANGVYFVNIKTENEMVNRKIILAK